MSLTQKQVKKLTGLTEQQVESIRQKEGFNELPFAIYPAPAHWLFATASRSVLRSARWCEAII